MHITRYTDYALRVLMYLASKGEEQSTIREISQSYDISNNHLMKVVQQLNNKGYIIAIRGKNGGIRLNGPAKQVNIGALIRDMETDLAIVECFSPNNTCSIVPVCKLKNIFGEALNAFIDVLDKYTLADLIQTKNKKMFMQILNITHEKN